MDATASGEALLSTMTFALWGVAGLAALFYFATGFLLEILAQKHHEPRWMAWVPVASGYLMMRLVGWGTWFWVLLAGYAIGFLGMLLPGALKLVSLVVVLPTALAFLVIGLAYFPKLAVKRGLGVGVGLWVVVPQFAPAVVGATAPDLGAWVALAASLAALVAFLWIVFHDGGPKHGPHPVGYVLTLVCVLVLGGLLHALPGYVADDAQLADALQKLKNEVQLELGASPLERFRTDAKDPDKAISKKLPKGSPLEEPPPVEIPDTCPRGTREASGPTPGGGRAWWCETEIAGRWVKHGPARSWHANGYLESEGRYDEGQRSGTWTRYWRTGGRRFQAEFARDVQHGWMHSWDAVGTFETAVRYEDGEVAGP